MTLIAVWGPYITLVVVSLDIVVSCRHSSLLFPWCQGMAMSHHSLRTPSQQLVCLHHQSWQPRSSTQSKIQTISRDVCICVRVLFDLGYILGISWIRNVFMWSHILQVASLALEKSRDLRGASEENLKIWTTSTSTKLQHNTVVYMVHVYVRRSQVFTRRLCSEW